MQNAAATARKFEQFVTKYGNDPFIAKTIDKMVSTRLGQIQKELKLLQISLNRFERAFNKSSEAFIAEYQTGLAGDALDAVEWSSLIKMKERLLVEQAALMG